MIDVTLKEIEEEKDKWCDQCSSEKSTMKLQKKAHKRVKAPYV